MIIEKGSVKVFMGLNEAQISFLTKDKHTVDKLLNDNEKHALRADFKPLRANRSKDANAYLWVLCDKIAEAVNSTKEEIYRKAIREVGVYQDIAVQEQAVADLVRIWQDRGLGWFSDEFDSKLDGCKRIRLYSGSHVYDTKEMSRLIQYVVEEAKVLGIETLTPEELKQMEEEYGA